MPQFPYILSEDLRGILNEFSIGWGSFSQYVIGPRTLVMTKSPSLFGDIYLGWLLSLRFVASNQTLSPFSNGVNPHFDCPIIICHANSCIAIASVHTHFKSSILFSTDGMLVLSVMVGIVVESYPIMR